ncbi:glycosyltransferase WbuB [Arthrobacter sp. AQ5-05]|uniref:glycosyltransferase family 4 protein n=1 Tax=Arthrobacter sp. AQ5-05 TaxID=2184581 RepID=UPI000DCB91E6|nr:glycosyltransferase family 4 protein [Arthrobacter sp. AQ5-05]RAX46557.1 glycosyltransferase WbuB [Arthrobacter sp. AQ5-05]
MLTISKIVSDNMRDDPTFFILQASRRLESRSLARLGSTVNGLLPKRAVVLNAFTLMLSGNTTSLGEYLRSLPPKQLSDRTLARLGDMAVAIQDSDSAAHLLENRQTTNVALSRSQARHSWYLGNMQDAVELLETVVPNTNRQLRHYRSELDVFQGRMPILNHGESNRRHTGGSIPTTALHFLTNSLPHTGSGYAQRSHSIMTSLGDQGWSLEVLTRAGYPLSIGKFRARAVDVIDGVAYRRVLPWKYQSDMGAKVQQQAGALAEAVRRLNPGVLHTTTDFTNALAVMTVAEAFNIPWVYEVRGQLADTWASTRPESAKTSQRYKLFKEREAFVAAHATHVLTLGEAMKAELIEQGIPDAKISIAPNAIGDDYLEEPIPRSRARGMLGLSMEHQYIGTVSSLVAYEGLDLLLEAAAELIPANPALRVLIVGSGVEANNLQDLSRKLGISEYCVFPGRVPREEARTYHCALDIFVVPRRNLSVTRAVTPLKPVEALACEVPVVAADLPALRELVVDGETGVLVAPESPHLLAEALRMLLGNSSKRASMGAAGRRQMLAERTWAANARKLSETYKVLADKLQ